jgi:hypothetical protein
VDHELVSNIDADCARREARLTSGGPVRYLLTIGGAGAQAELYLHIIDELLPEVKRGRAVLLLNVGDHHGRLEIYPGASWARRRRDGRALRRHGRRDEVCRRRLDGEVPACTYFATATSSPRCTPPTSSCAPATCW